MAGHALDSNHLDHAPWEFVTDATSAERAEQARLQADLVAARPGSTFGTDCFVSALAAVQTDVLHVGDRSTVAAYAHLSGRVRIGADASVNVATAVRGEVTIGDGARIGSHVSVLGFNHGTVPGVPVREQPLTSRGVSIGDDVWVGSHAVVLDGVTVGDGAVVGAAAVVTRDVPAGAVVVGNPARVVRWRDPGLAPDAVLRARLAAFAEHVPDDVEALLARCWDPARRRFVDVPGTGPTLRAQADAVQLARTVGRPLGVDEVVHAALLRGAQDPVSGLLGEEGEDRAELDLLDGADSYHLLSVGHALDLLGSRLPHPVVRVATMTATELVELLDGLPWDTDPWHAGHLVDGVATALRWNVARGSGARPGVPEALFGWLTTRASTTTGTWGRPVGPDARRLAVNGWYRAVRGTFATLGLPVPHPDRVVDTVLGHAADDRWFAPARQTACDVLDVVHPLWLLRDRGYRRDEVRALVVRLLGDALDHAAPGGGFGFRAPDAAGRRDGDAAVGLQGTEMWLTIVWLAADLLGHAELLSFRPCGTHEPGTVAFLGVR